MVEEVAVVPSFMREGLIIDELTSIPQFVKTVVHPAVYPERVPLEVAAHHLHGEPIPAREALRRPFAGFSVGESWGGMWDTTWFRLRGTIPGPWKGSEVVALIHLGGDEVVGFTAEGLIWDLRRSHRPRAPS